MMKSTSHRMTRKRSKLVASQEVNWIQGKAWPWTRARCRRASLGLISVRERPSAASSQPYATRRRVSPRTFTIPRRWTERSLSRSLSNSKKTAITRSSPLSVDSITSAFLIQGKRSRWSQCNLSHAVLKVMAIFLRRIRTQIKCLTAIKANRCRESTMISNTTKDTICNLLVKT